MNEKYDFYIAGRTRNKENILKIYDILEGLNTKNYCFLKNEISHAEAGFDLNDEKLAEKFEKLGLQNNAVKTIFEHDMKGIHDSKNFLLVLPAGKASHIEAGVAYGLGKKCYAIGEYDVTDSLYLIFDKIFVNEDELINFIKENK